MSREPVATLCLAAEPKLSAEGHSTLQLVPQTGPCFGVDCPRQPTPGNAGPGGGAGPNGGAGPGPDGGAGSGGGVTTTATATPATNNNPSSPASSDTSSH